MGLFDVIKFDGVPNKKWIMYKYPGKEFFDKSTLIVGVGQVAIAVHGGKIEQIKKPFLTKEQIHFGIEKFKKLNISTKEGKQRLIDGFINAIYLYDDKITFTFNYKDGTKTVFLSELNCTPSGSDLKCLGAPRTDRDVESNDITVCFFM